MLLDWTGRELRADKRGAIPEHLAPIVDRLGLNRSNWVETVRGFGRLFKQAAGRPSSLVDAAGAARGAGSRARRRLEPRLCRPLTLRRAVSRHLEYAFLNGRGHPVRSIRCPDRLESDRRTVQLLTSSDHEQKPPSSRFGRHQTALQPKDWMRRSTAPTGDFLGVGFADGQIGVERIDWIRRLGFKSRDLDKSRPGCKNRAC